MVVAIHWCESATGLQQADSLLTELQGKPREKLKSGPVFRSICKSLTDTRHVQNKDNKKHIYSIALVQTIIQTC